MFANVCVCVCVRDFVRVADRIYRLSSQNVSGPIDRAINPSIFSPYFVWADVVIVKEVSSARHLIVEDQACWVLQNHGQ